MNSDLKRIKDTLQENDHFINRLGITIDELREGSCKASMILDGSHRNRNNFVNGGALYTLADFAAACAASSYGYKVTTISGAVNYLTGVAGIDEIFAYAHVIKFGKRIIDIDVSLNDSEGNLYMQCSLTFFNLQKPFFDE